VFESKICKQARGCSISRLKGCGRLAADNDALAAGGDGNVLLIGR